VNPTISQYRKVAHDLEQTTNLRKVNS